MPDRWGIGPSYVDTTGREQVIPHATVARLREIIGEPTAGHAPLVVGPGERVDVGAGEIVLEDGTHVVVHDTLPPEIPFGYHTFTADAGASRRVIVSPRRCHLPPGRRAWGWAVQLYATRSSASWGMGDLGDLARVARWSHDLGAGFVLANPLGAPAPAGPQQPSPYFPATRRYRNPLYLRIEDVPGAADVGETLERAATVGRALNERRHIDRDAVWRIKRPVLEAIWRSDAARDEFEAWYLRQPASLRQFAVWSVVVEQLGPSWREWPVNYRHPDGMGIAMVGDEHGDRVRFHAWLQWLLERQLDAAAAATSIMHDLPIGVDPDGFDAWAWQDILALDASVGAPPDAFNRQGQQWGLPPFIPWMLREAYYQPFIDTIRANIAPGGGMRLDHVAGLFRLWWVPAGNSATDGAYVHYPADDLLAIVALESHRAASIIIGEDLGTVEETARQALADHDILSYRLLWFEHRDPAEWPSKAMAAITTHDLPTVAGLWDGSDVSTQRALALEPDAEANEAIRDRLARAAELPATASTRDAVVAAHELLARAPAALLSATLEDAVAEPGRPNIPGTDGQHLNWCTALAVPIDEIETHPLALRVAAVLRAATDDGRTLMPPDGVWFRHAASGYRVPMQDEDLAADIARLLAGRSVATAESCTAGRIAETLASVDKAVEFFRGGLVAYQDAVKRSFLAVSAASTLSEAAASEMALGACRMFESDVAVATTGVAGDEPEDGVVPGTVFVATAVDGTVRVGRYQYDASPPQVCDLARHQALVDLRAALRDAR